MNTQPEDLVYPITYKDEYGCTYLKSSLSKLEYFAAMAMQGILSNNNDECQRMSPDKIARYSVQQAKALINALHEGGE